MTEEILYKECPLCVESPVILDGNIYRCDNCGLSLKERSIMGIFQKGQFTVEKLPDLGGYSLAASSMKNVKASSEVLTVVLGNIYSDGALSQIAQGNLEVMRPVRTVLAQIILEQLREECFVNVIGLRRGYGPPLQEESSYFPQNMVPAADIKWQDEGNLFCTTNRLVLPSNQFTFIRLGRKVSAVKAFSNGIAIQLKNEPQATYFVGCYPHEAALIAAYVLGRVPLLRPTTTSE
jgi:hypothetical protein